MLPDDEGSASEPGIEACRCHSLLILAMLDQLRNLLKVYLNSGSATISDKNPAGVHHFVEAITSS